MLDHSGRLFSILCADCQRLLMTVPLIRDPEISVLEAHLRGCWLSEPLPAAPVMAGPIMRRLRVVAAERT